MTEVPFERVGPGQVLRLAIQVIGKDGPIPNPRNIRFMAAGDLPNLAGVGLNGPMPSGLPGASALAGVAQIANLGLGVVQIANLGLGVANVGIGIATLVEVRKQTRMLRELQVDVTEIRAGVAELLTISKRTDLNVAEVHLRNNLGFALRSAWSGEEADLEVLRDLTGKALAKFAPSLGRISPGTRRDLVLSPDVREMAEAALHLLWSARVSAVEAHNVAVAGDARRVQRDDVVQQELRRIAEAAAVVGIAKTRVGRLADEVGDDLRDSNWFFGSSRDFRKSISKKVKGLDSDLDQLQPVPAARLVLDELEGQKAMTSARKQGAEELTTVVENYLLAWVAHSDAGLLWRLQHELDTHSDPSYWIRLDAWLQPLPGSDATKALGASRPALPLALGQAGRAGASATA